MASSCSPSSPSLDTFYLFTQLPTELRLKIYTLSIPDARLVPIRYLSPASTPDSISHGSCSSPVVIPSLLHVSREARSIALEFYSLSFRLSGPPTTFLPKIYFSSSQNDVLYFGPKEGYLASFWQFSNVLILVDPNELIKVKRLAVHESMFLSRIEAAGGGRTTSNQVDVCLKNFWELVMRKFQGLESVVIVGSGRELDVLREIGGQESWRSWDEGSGEVVRWDAGWGQKYRRLAPVEENFHSKVARAVRSLETERNWAAPRWKVLMSKQHVWGDRLEGVVEERRESMWVSTETVEPDEYLVKRRLRLEEERLRERSVWVWENTTVDGFRSQF
jgi:hypothetical protein